MAEAPQQGQGQSAPEATANDGTQVQAEDAQQAFSQKDVNKLLGKRAKEAETRYESKLLERAREVNPDVQSLDEVFSGFSEYQGIQEAVTTEADRANEKAEKLEKRAKTAEERYTNTLREYALRDSLRDAGINPERLRGAMRLADLDALEVDKDGNVSGLDEVVEAVREEAPEFFGATERPRVNAPQTNGTGIQTPGSTQTPEEMQAAWLAQFIGR